MMRIDVHSHAYADKIVERAMQQLKSRMPPDYQSEDGRLTSLVASLAENGLDAAVVCSIATKPPQFDVIMEWSAAIRNGVFGEETARRVIPFISIHPSDPDRYGRVEQIAKAGFKGLKFHPYYQGFVLDDPEAIDLFRCVARNGLTIICHVGFDIAYPHDRICDPVRVRRVAEALPDAKFIAAHFGGWMDWDEAEAHLVGQPIDIEISLALDNLPLDRVRDMIMRHPQDRLHYGSDWPWSRHAESLALLEKMALPRERLTALLGGNSRRLILG